MICPNCEMPISDDTNACPHCGSSIERSFCPTCGQAIGGTSNSKGLTVFVVVVLTAIILVMVAERTIDFSFPSNEPFVSETSRPDERTGFQIIQKNTISLGENSTEEWMIRVERDSEDVIVAAGMAAIQEAKSELSYDQVNVYIYTGDQYAEDPARWRANMLYISSSNSTAQIPSSAEKIDDNIYIRWN